MGQQIEKTNNRDDVLLFVRALPESQQADYQYYEDVNWGLLRLWGHRAGKDVLDVGCGFATTSQHIQRLGNRVTGVPYPDRTSRSHRREVRIACPARALNYLDRKGRGEHLL